MKFLCGSIFALLSLSVAAGPVKLVDVIFGFSNSTRRLDTAKLALGSGPATVNNLISIDRDLRGLGFAAPTRRQFEEWLGGIRYDSLKANLVNLLHKDFSEVSGDEMVRAAALIGYFARKFWIKSESAAMADYVSKTHLRHVSTACSDCVDDAGAYSDVLFARQVFLAPVERRADVTGWDNFIRIYFKDDRTMFSNEQKDLETAKIAFEFGADVNVKDDLGNTGLILAAKNGRRRFVEFFIDAGADLNAQSSSRYESPDHPSFSFGNTALMLAVLNREVDAVKMLLEAGADYKKLRNSNGRTAEEIAEALGRLSGSSSEGLAIRKLIYEQDDK